MNSQIVPLVVSCKVWEMESMRSFEPVSILKKFTIENLEEGISKEKAEELLKYLRQGYRISIRVFLNDGRIGRGNYIPTIEPINDETLVAFQTERQKVKREKQKFELANLNEIAEALSVGTKDLTDEQKEHYRFRLEEALKAERAAIRVAKKIKKEELKKLKK